MQFQQSLKNSKIGFLFLVLVIICSLTLVGCGKKEKKQASKTVKQELSGKGVKREKLINIGAILPLTGPASSFGQYVKEGIDLAIQEINSNSQCKFKIIYEDSKGFPKEALSSYNRLIALYSTPVVIAALSSVASVLHPLASKTHTVQIYVDVVKPNVTDGNYTFRIYPEAYGTAGVLAKFSMYKLKAKKAAVIYINDAYGDTSLNVFKKFFKEHGGNVVFAESYNFMQKDFRDTFLKLKKRYSFDVVYVNGYGPAFVQAIKQLREVKIHTPIVADVALGLPDNLHQLGKAAEGIYYVDTKLSPTFIKKFEEKYKKEPSSDAGFAYDTIKILYNIFKKTHNFSVNNIRKALKSLKGYHGVTGLISMQSDGNVKLEFVIMRVINGKPKVLGKIENLISKKLGKEG